MGRLLLLALVAVCCRAACPFGEGRGAEVASPAGAVAGAVATASAVERRRLAYVEALREVDFALVRASLRLMFVTDVEAWPMDFDTYAPLFVRLAWHNAGTYRLSDGRGGVDGARQRFDPERSWADNTNLDKARALLWGVKEQWPTVSWGDLIVLAGTEAIASMGGPDVGTCAGRLDDPDGSDSSLLGPTAAQAAWAPCPVDGNCSEPLGATTLGLIYVNPEGPMGEPDPAESAAQVRDTFARMGMGDAETVALIGGGHAFGKTHGACPAGAGPTPAEDPRDPWPGNCGSGKGKDAFTSGFEGAWTSRPTTFDNEYFHNLLETRAAWAKHKGPGGRWQWRLADRDIMMLTSDLALVHDPTYLDLVQTYAGDFDAFTGDFGEAWYKLVTRDMGPFERCATGLKNLELPEARPFQYPLPATKRLDLPGSSRVLSSKTTTDDDDVKRLELAIGAALPNMTLPLITLAWACASTFRATDHLGGCDGARIRFSPQRDWDSGTDATLKWLGHLERGTVSWADTIVLAGTVAMRSVTPTSYSFCAGRSDANDEGATMDFLAPFLTGAFNETAGQLKEAMARSGLTREQYVAIFGARRSLSPQFSLLPNASRYFETLLEQQWVVYQDPLGRTLYKAQGLEVYAESTDLNLRDDPELLPIVQQFAAQPGAFLEHLQAGWTTLMNIDRFGNKCPQPL